MEAELWLPRHALHSAKLSLEIGARKVEWSSPLPDDLAEFVRLAGDVAEPFSGLSAAQR
jgi:hypothetical protein